ncbi:MAG: ankyrin repeat domain-containing protein [Desulfobacteraceae bacterium]|nr:ankyrin repeat domain-containing protein [Desulfobacteraceae bacterium]
MPRPYPDLANLSTYTLASNNDIAPFSHKSKAQIQRLQLSNQNHYAKAKAYNNDLQAAESNTSVSLLKWLRQTIRKNRPQEYKDQHLLNKVIEGDVKWAKKWIESGADVNKTIRVLDWTLLHKALIDDRADVVINDRADVVINDRADVVKVLISSPDINESTINQPDFEGQTALYMAARKGYTDIVKLLLNHPNTRNTINLNFDNGKHFLLPIYAAACKGHAEVVEALLNHPRISVSTINQPDFKGQTALYMAARKGYTDIVKLLLNHPNTRNTINLNFDNGEHFLLPINAAVCKGHAEVVEALLNHPRISVSNSFVYSASYWANSQGYTDIVNLLKSHPKTCNYNTFY